MAAVRPSRHLSRYLLPLFIGLAVPFGCGGRTGLDSQDPCYTEGEFRNCNNVCGTGTQVCAAGYWQTCQVAPTEVECTNDCGGGLAHCEDGVKAECVVERTSKTCENDCGLGLKWCENNTWGTCEVAPQRTRLRKQLRPRHRNLRGWRLARMLRPSARNHLFFGMR